MVRVQGRSELELKALYFPDFVRVQLKRDGTR